MPQHAKRIKIRRKELRQPDEFETLTGRAVDWASENQVILAVAATAIIVAAAIVFGFSQWRAAQASRAAIEFDGAYQVFEAGRNKEAAEKFALVSDTYPRASSGRLARLYRAHALLREGQATAAAAAYDEYMTFGPPTPYLRQETLAALGHAREAAGDAPGALEAYRQASEIEGPFKQDSLLGVARLQEAAGRAADARAIYSDLLKTTSDADLKAFLLTKVPAPADGPGAQATAGGAQAAPEAEVR
jgi:hypothetical protein